MMEIPIALYSLSAISGLIGDFKRSIKISSVLSAIASLSLLGIAAHALSRGLPVQESFLGIPLIIDSLSLPFLFIIALLSLVVSVYSISYMEVHRDTGRPLAYTILYGTFVLSIVFVALTSNLLWFVFFWELMTLTSFIFVSWREQDAGIKYLLTMQLANTVPLFVALGIIYSATGSFSVDYATLREVASSLSPVQLKLLYAMFLVTFLAKSGSVPFQFWVPDAYEAAPSNIASLMAGVMEKMAVYGLIRLLCNALPCSEGIGYVLVIVGILTMTFGTLYALRETHAKRLLAYSSVGQMGYIWFAVGMGMIFLTMGMESLAYLAFLAGVFHSFNHTLFKGLLFLISGNFEYSAGTADLNELGGLRRAMPYSSLFTVIGALSLAGVPLFSGFLSKWMIYQAGYYSGIGLFVFGSVMAVFMSAVTLAYSLKLYTSAFGGEPNERTENAREVPSGMLLGEGIIALTSLAVGILPAIAYPILTISLNGGDVTVTMGSISTDFEYFSPIALLLAVSFIAVASYFVFRPKTTNVKPWNTGALFLPEERYGAKARDYYRQYFTEMEGLYKLGSAAGKVGRVLLSALMSVYLVLARGLVYTGREKKRSFTLDELRHRTVRYLDEAFFAPMMDLLKNIAVLAAGISVSMDELFLASMLTTVIILALLVL
ncbi:Hydrogenase 4, component B or formate hydrogen lyase, subunit 3 [Thermococcus onnurineus NA1]|uniref:Hydrogenase 4, component B or formate hydrogen lyase, subunit 3 n=1 Tax=Thermococcus onnurineus (strain NA1) TaxID=523850 RepID=B6YT76_THEON|nr:proton-conducting transporter membrane subunit [Thermococcus onnurineus]ACJ15763.1 Hydrogenase 4, component B or formate hydrogen lyase, subunit 3 [Thermococcus onnurineus NA1]